MKESKKINECIKRRRDADEEAKISKRRKVGKHSTYSPELRARVGKYAAENGATRAARHYSKEMGFEMNESGNSRTSGVGTNKRERKTRVTAQWRH